jgi:alkanesulfonate monooxygenase SsuD/methylene tetrahydromethanopterin reductase-like flavin-dependent oxidoreductase (luciferase family)
MSEPTAAPGAGAAERPRVRFGVFDWIDERRGDDLAALYDGRLQIVEYADQAGFYCYHLAEHHWTPLCTAPSPNLFLAAAAQRTRQIRLGPLVYLLPLYNPLRLMEEICMLDHLSHGRLEVGVGRGASPYELAPFHVPIEEARDIFTEALAILVQGLSTGEVHHDGQYFSFENVRAVLHPRQRPYPPL